MKAPMAHNHTRCPMCDEWYDPDGERAEVHQHPEPQSGAPRRALVASRLPYARWLTETVEGRAWDRTQREAR